MKKEYTDPTDYIESAARLITSEQVIYGKGTCSAPCKSCGGGCYGCKGSKGAEISSNSKDSALVDLVVNLLD
jgi:coenzyme F420-reducing hydrogenase gamma subunit